MLSTLSIKVSPFEGPLYRQIATQIKQLIDDEVLKPGDRLPSVRDLSRQLQVSMSVMMAVLRQLESQGIVQVRQGAGVYVAQQGLGTQPIEAAKKEIMELPNHSEEQMGQPDDFLAKLQTSRGILSSLRTDLQWPTHRVCAQGLYDLRQSIVYWMKKTSGVVCDPEHVMVVAGKPQAYQLIAHLDILNPGQTDTQFEIEHERAEFLAFNASADKICSASLNMSPNDEDVARTLIYMGSTSVWLPERISINFVVVPKHLRQQSLNYISDLPSVNTLHQRIAACLLSCSKYEDLLMKEFRFKHK